MPQFKNKDEMGMTGASIYRKIRIVASELVHFLSHEKRSFKIIWWAFSLTFQILTLPLVLLSCFAARETVGKIIRFGLSGYQPLQRYFHPSLCDTIEFLCNPEQFVERKTTLYGPAFDAIVDLDGSLVFGHIATVVLESKLQDVDYSRLRREWTCGLLISSARLKFLTLQLSQRIFGDKSLKQNWEAFLASAVDDVLKDAWRESNIPFARQKIRIIRDIALQTVFGGIVPVCDAIEQYLLSAKRRSFRDSASKAKHAKTTIVHWLEAKVLNDLSGITVDDDGYHKVVQNSLLQTAWSFITNSSTSESYRGEKMDILFCFAVEHCYSCLTQQLHSTIATMLLQSRGSGTSDGSMRYGHEEEESWAGWMEQRGHLFDTPKPDTNGYKSWESGATCKLSGRSSSISSDAGRMESTSGNKVEMFDEDDDDDMSLLTTPHFEAEFNPVSAAEEPNHSASLDVYEQQHRQAYTDDLIKRAQRSARRVLDALTSSPSRPHYSVYICLQECTLHMSSPATSIFQISHRKSIHLPSGRFTIFIHNSNSDLQEEDLGWFSRTVLEHFIDQLMVYFDDNFSASRESHNCRSDEFRVLS